MTDRGQLKKGIKNHVSAPFMRALGRALEGSYFVRGYNMLSYFLQVRLVATSCSEQARTTWEASTF